VVWSFLVELALLKYIKVPFLFNKIKKPTE